MQSQITGLLKTAIAAEGYASLREFMERNERSSYADLVDKLRVGVAPIHFIAYQYLEARKANSLRAAAIDHLVRVLIEQLPQGWPPSDRTCNPSMPVVLGGWCSEFVVTGRNAQYQDTVEQIANWLICHAKPGWLPQGPADPLIVSAFGECWPMDSGGV